MPSRYRISRLAAFTAIASTGPLRWLAATSVSVLILSVLFDQSAGHAAHHGDAVDLYQATGDWFVMVLAMMLPLVSSQVALVRNSVAHRTRFAATGWFLTGYVGMWTFFGVILRPLAELLLAPALSALGPLLWLCISITWSATPLAQLARNLCHKQQRVAAFGRKALVDSLFFGLRIGGLCFLSCWPWMVLPLLVDNLHLPVMVAVTLYMFADRISNPAAVQWRTPPAFQVLFGR